MKKLFIKLCAVVMMLCMTMNCFSIIKVHALDDNQIQLTELTDEDLPTSEDLKQDEQPIIEEETTVEESNDVATEDINPIDGTDIIICKIGSVGFTSLDDAVNYAKAGQSTTITIVGDITQVETVEIPEDKTIILKDDGTKRTITASQKTLFDIKGTMVLEGTNNDNLVLDGGQATNTNIAYVNGTLTMNHATINGGTYTTLNGVLCFVGGTFNLNDGYIQNCIGDNSQFSAPIRIFNRSTMIMTGGEIRNNNCLTGAGICAIREVNDKLTDDDMPTVIISGGKITNNQGGLGVALMAAYKANVTISGGEFSNNKDTLLGYKTSLQSGTIYVSRSELNISGGDFKDNKMRKGGALYLSRESTIRITAGSFLNNTADEYGGAIFMDDNKPNVYIENALITNNTANEVGGGIWCCPTGTSRLQATDGVAIFDNTAKKAGDDFTNLYTEKQNFPVELSSRILGGGKVEYYKDGKIYVLDKEDKNYWHGGIDTSAPRYFDGTDKIDLDNMTNDCLSLKAIVSDGAKAAAKQEAKTLIIGNSADYGGAIACNATLFGLKNENSDNYSLKVNKVWKNVPVEKQVPITVALVVDGQEVDYAILNDDNNWEAIFTDLPAPHTLKDAYKVIEKTEGFDVEYSALSTSEDDDKLLQITITNKPKETPPGETPPGDIPEKPKQKTTIEKPKTGDDTNMMIFVSEIIGTCILFGCLIKYKKHLQ